MAKSRAEEKQVMKKKQQGEKKKSFDALSAFLALLIIAISIVGVNCYISQYEKNYQNTQLSAELAEVQNEGKLLDIEYQSRSNYRNIEKYASENLSMKKISSYQIEYIDDQKQESMQVIEHEQNENFFSRISKAFSVILEYFQ